MRHSLKMLVAALAMLVGVGVFTSPGEARTVLYGGGSGIALVRDHGHGYRHHDGGYRRGGFGASRRYYRGGPRYYRHGSYRRDRGFYGRPRHDWNRRYYGGRHYRGNGVVIRLR